MDATEAAKALVEWAVEICPTLTSVYDYDPASIDAALPVALAGIAEEEDSAGDPRLGIVIDQAPEQAVLHTMRASIEFVVDKDPAEGAAEQLEGFVNALAEALRAEWRNGGTPTLGGRFEAASPYWQGSYAPPLFEFDDGTIGRRAAFALVVAELI